MFFPLSTMGGLWDGYYYIAKNDAKHSGGVFSFLALEKAFVGVSVVCVFLGKKGSYDLFDDIQDSY